MKRINFLFFLPPKIPQNSPQNPLNPNSCERETNNQLNMENNIIVRFDKTGNLYKVLEENSEMKHPISREWISAVIYMSYKKLVDGEYVEETEPKVYIREKKEFLERFTPVLDF